MALIMVAHGTRRPEGVAMVEELAAQASSLAGRPVALARDSTSLGVGPSTSTNATSTGRPAIVLPAFLSRGYHVRADLPAHVELSGHPNAIVTPALGPSGQVARIVGDQLVKCGWRPGDSVILAAAGTSDARARADLHTTATLVSALTGSRVSLGFAATGDPQLPEAVDEARRHAPNARVVVASYLLADGMFQERLHACGADLVSRPLGTHPGLARLIASRFRRAMPPVLAPTARHASRRPAAQRLVHDRVMRPNPVA